MLEHVVWNSSVSFELSNLDKNIIKNDLFCWLRDGGLYKTHYSLPFDQTAKRNSNNYFIFAGFEYEMIVSELSFEYFSFRSKRVSYYNFESLSLVSPSFLIQSFCIIFPNRIERIESSFLKLKQSNLISILKKLLIPILSVLLLSLFLSFFWPGFS